MFLPTNRAEMFLWMKENLQDGRGFQRRFKVGLMLEFQRHFLPQRPGFLRKCATLQSGHPAASRFDIDNPVRANTVMHNVFTGRTGNENRIIERARNPEKRLRWVFAALARDGRFRAPIHWNQTIHFFVQQQQQKLPLCCDGQLEVGC